MGRWGTSVGEHVVATRPHANTQWFAESDFSLDRRCQCWTLSVP